jgi:hypothetical protein
MTTRLDDNRRPPGWRDRRGALDVFEQEPLPAGHRRTLPK